MSKGNWKLLGAFGVGALIGPMLIGMIRSVIGR